MSKVWDPNKLIEAAEKSGVDFAVDDDWLKIDPYGAKFDPTGVVWHHTACSSLAKGNMPSLNYCRNPGMFTGKARACHIVLGRNGFMQFIAGRGAYHAGRGGPMTLSGMEIPEDLGNYHLIGIEIEASSTAKVQSRNVRTPKWNMNPAQFEAATNFSAALCDVMAWDTESVIRHRDWAPGRKIDVQISLSMIQNAVNKRREETAPPPPPTPLWDGKVPPIDTVNKGIAEDLASLAIYRVAARLYDLKFYTGAPPVKYEQKYPKKAIIAFQQAQGWSGSGNYGVKTHEALFGVKVPAPVPIKPSVNLKNVQPKVTHKDVTVVRDALKEEFGPQTRPDKDEYFGAATKAQYVKWQKKLGYTGTDADGIPGVTSLRKLGKKHGFTVKTP